MNTMPPGYSSAYGVMKTDMLIRSAVSNLQSVRDARDGALYVAKQFEGSFERLLM